MVTHCIVLIDVVCYKRVFKIFRIDTIMGNDSYPFPCPENFMKQFHGIILSLSWRR